MKSYPIKTDGLVDIDREFKHLTHEGLEVFENDRSERLLWTKTLVEEKVTDSSIYIFSLVE